MSNEDTRIKDKAEAWQEGNNEQFPKTQGQSGRETSEAWGFFYMIPPATK